MCLIRFPGLGALRFTSEMKRKESVAVEEGFSTTQ